MASGNTRRQFSGTASVALAATASLASQARAQPVAATVTGQANGNASDPGLEKEAIADCKRDALKPIEPVARYLGFSA